MSKSHSYSCTFPEGCSCGASEFNAFVQQLATARTALELQRDALYTVRDRQGGYASHEDLTKGINLIGTALAQISPAAGADKSSAKKQD